MDIIVILNDILRVFKNVAVQIVELFDDILVLLITAFLAFLIIILIHKLPERNRFCFNFLALFSIRLFVVRCGQAFKTVFLILNLGIL